MVQGCETIIFTSHTESCTISGLSYIINNEQCTMNSVCNTLPKKSISKIIPSRCGKAVENYSLGPLKWFQCEILINEWKISQIFAH